jgi:ankyrin repeat protein
MDDKEARYKLTERFLQACERRDWETVKLLLNCDIDINQTIGTRNLTALTCAIFYDQLPLAKAMLKRGADPNKRCAYGWSALTQAVLRHNVKAARLLLKHGANFDFMPQEKVNELLGAQHRLRPGRSKWMLLLLSKYGISIKPVEAPTCPITKPEKY